MEGGDRQKANKKLNKMKLEASNKYMKKIKFDHMMEAGRQQGRMS